MDAPILLIEDDDDDVALTMHALRSAHVERPVRHISSGRTAIDYLRRQGAHSDLFSKNGVVHEDVAEEAGGAGALDAISEDGQMPVLIILDLQIPDATGHDVIRAVRGSSSLKHIPIVVLSSSTRDEDVVQSYDLGANAFVTKPIEPDEYVRAFRCINDFFLKTMVQPLPVITPLPVPPPLDN